MHCGQGKAFLAAALRGRVSIMDLLLAAGADVHARDDEALWWAVEGGHEAVAQLLRAHAAGALETRVQPSA